MLTTVLEAKENCDVAVIDIPNAFIQTPNEKLKEHHKRDLMKIKGALAEILVELYPEEYGPFITYEKGVPVLYLELLMAIYGMIKSPLLFYRKLRKDLEEYGFIINPYMTVVWLTSKLKAHN